jgi:hypothetical protein
MPWKLKLKTSLAGPSGVFNVGDYYSTDDVAEARRMIALGAAEPVGPPPPPGTAEEQRLAKRVVVQTASITLDKDGFEIGCKTKDPVKPRPGRQHKLPPLLDASGRPYSRGRSDDDFDD